MYKLLPQKLSLGCPFTFPFTLCEYPGAPGNTSATTLYSDQPAYSVVCLPLYSWLLIASIVQYDAKLYAVCFARVLLFFHANFRKDKNTIPLQYAINGREWQRTVIPLPFAQPLPQDTRLQASWAPDIVQNDTKLFFSRIFVHFSRTAMTLNGVFIAHKRPTVRNDNKLPSNCSDAVATVRNDCKLRPPSSHNNILTVVPVVRVPYSASRDAAPWCL